MTPARWVELVVRVLPADADAIAAVLGDLTPGGVAFEPAIRASDGADFTYELLEAPGVLRAAFPAPLSAARRRALRRALGALALSAPLLRLRWVQVEDQDWSQQWRRFFDVIHVGRRLVVRPSWRAYEPAAGELVVELDPGRAFGTGQHASTLLCLEALERELRPGERVLDLGTGSGILAVAAVRLGAGEVLALDIDSEAVTAATENVTRNGVAGCVRVCDGSLGARWPGPGEPRALADVVLANISAAALVGMMAQLARALRPGGRVVLGGFVASGVAEVRAAAAAAGLRVTAELAREDWRCLVAGAAGAEAA
ncbi:MAG: 50S ribosomal protein L11 methyltransferase [Dehalococcoidia bacterium]|nr:50S ribosomal protein L11 methyltransferase [Dehalococcoidia bacterium]